jgi:hypothetical protein
VVVGSMKGKITVTGRGKDVIHGDTYSVTSWSIVAKGMFQLWSGRCGPATNVCVEAQVLTRSETRPSVGPAGTESRRHWPVSGAHPLSTMLP